MTSNPLAKRYSRQFQIRLVAKGALVGLAAGCVVTLYRLALGQTETLMRHVSRDLVNRGAAGLALWAAVVLVMVILIGQLVKRVPQIAGSGIPQVEAEIMGRYDMPWLRSMLGKAAAGIAGAFAGFSLGREGPSVQLGALCGKAVSRAKKAHPGEEHLLVTCGAGAGMAAAFQAPLTGVMFAIEEIHKSFTAPLVVGCMSSSVVSVLVASAVFGAKPVLSLTFTDSMPHADYWMVIVLGVALGLLGSLHNAGMFKVKSLLGRIGRFQPYSRYAVAGVFAVAAVLWVPEVLDGGDGILRVLQRPEGLTLATFAFLLVAKYVATAVASGSGVPGGTLFPLVCLGALAGGFIGLAANTWFGLEYAYVTNFMLLGIAGLFASVIRTPVTGCVLVFELTGSFTELLPLALVSLVSYVVASTLPVDGFYEHLLGDLLDGTDSPAVSNPGVSVRTFTVGQGSYADGMSVGDVRWPDHVSIASVMRHGKRHAATDGTTLEAGDFVVVVIDAPYEARVTNALQTLLHSESGPLAT